MTKRAITYARVSGDDSDKEGRNLAEQLRMCREYANSKGYTIVSELAEDDHGASGASLELEQLNKVLTMAQAGEFDILVVREIDRLSRRLAKQLIVEESLKRCNVSIDYVIGEYPDSPEGNLMKNVKASVAEYEREKIKERMTRGRRVMVRSGSVITQAHALLGYQRTEKDGKYILEVIPHEAEIVRLIFSMYAEGMPLSRLTKELTRLGIPSPSDPYPDQNHPKKAGYGVWARSTVSNILTNTTYIGEWRYGKTSPINGNSAHRTKNGQDYWITVNVPAIIEMDTWQKVRERLSTNKHLPKRSTKYAYLLATRIYCPGCGGKMRCATRKANGAHYFYYECIRHRVGGCNNRSSYPAELVDTLAWQWIKELLSDPESIRKGLENYRTAQESYIAPITQKLTTVDRLLEQNRASYDRLIELYVSGEVDKSMLIERKSRLEKTLQDLDQERINLRASLEKQTINEEQEQDLYELASQVKSALDAGDNDLITQRGLIERLKVNAELDFQDNHKVTYFSCILGETDLYIKSSPICRIGAEIAPPYSGRASKSPIRRWFAPPPPGSCAA